MIADFFINTTIILSFIFVGGQILQNASIQREMSFGMKLGTGIIGGILGGILIQFGVHIGDIMVDLRYLAVILAAIIGGPIASIVAALFILLIRIPLTAHGFALELACYTIITVGFGCAIISTWKTSMMKQWILLHSYSLIISSLTVYIAFQDVFKLFLYSAIFTGAGYITFVSLNYVVQSNELFRRMQQYATVDALTSLGNVRKFDMELNRYIEGKHIQNNVLCLLLIDIDHFKRINDRYGHPAGDEVLRQLGDILKRNSPFSELVFRKGGEEFAMLLPKATLQEALHVGERLRQAVEQHSFLLPDGTNLRVTISIGISNYEESPQQFIQSADDALYYSKRNGRNRVSSAPEKTKLSV